GWGGVGVAVPDYLGLRCLRAGATPPAADGPARSCIVLYCWGGMSHLDTLDLKPNAPAEVRGEFRPIRTATPGILVGEYLPRLARHTEKLALVRSMHHRSTAHGKGMYWKLTGHPPQAPELAVNQPPSRQDWPNLAAIVAPLRRPQPRVPAARESPSPTS